MDTKIRTLRIKKGLSQVELSRLSQVKLRTLQYYESGERKPPVDIAINIAEILEIQTLEEFKTIFGVTAPNIENKPDGNQV